MRSALRKPVHTESAESDSHRAAREERNRRLANGEPDRVTVRTNELFEAQNVELGAQRDLFRVRATKAYGAGDLEKARVAVELAGFYQREFTRDLWYARLGECRRVAEAELS